MSDAVAAEAAGSARLAGRTVIALVGCQVGLHGCLNGVRLVAPLLVLQQGRTAAALGLLMALFAIFPVMLALPAGRLADRRGYHLPVRLALGLVLAGALVGALSDHYLVLCVAASLVGAGSSIGMIALQRTAGRLAQNATERLRIFSWIAVAPSIANFVGPMLAGVLLDRAGFRAAFLGLALLPLMTLAFAQAVPRELRGAAPAGPARADAKHGPAWDLLRAPDFRRVLFVNWLITASWDAHSFALPVLGHARGLSASEIGAVLSVYAVASGGVRVAIPMLAHRLSGRVMMSGALLLTAGMFALYPVLNSGTAMAVCAAILGLGLGAVQPAMMAAMHLVTPPQRNGEALGLRSMLIHGSTLTMPLIFGALGTAVGVAPVFWLMAAALSAGGWQATRLPQEQH